VALDGVGTGHHGVAVHHRADSVRPAPRGECSSARPAPPLASHAAGGCAWTPQFGLGIAKKVLQWVFALVDRRNAREIQALYSLVLSRPLSDGVRLLRLRKGTHYP